MASTRPQLAGTDQQTQPYRWVILALMSATFIVTFFIRMTWPPLIPVVVPILHMKMSQAGAYMSAFYIGYVITQIPAGVLADRLGVRAILTCSLLVLGLSTIGMGSIGSYDSGFYLRVVTGLGAGAVFGAAIRALVEWFHPSERGFAFGIMFASPSAGIALSSVVVVALNARFGWQNAFRICGLFAVIVAILVLLLVKASAATQKSPSMFAGFPIVFGSRDLLLTSAAGFCLMWVELGTATWTVASIKKLGLSLGVAAVVLTVYGIGGILGPFLSGWLSDKIGRRKYIMIFFFIVLIPLTVVFGMQHTVAALTFWGFVFGFISYCINPHLTILVSEAVESKYAALANGTSNVIYQIAPMVVPIVTGWSVDKTGNFHAAWWIMAIGPLAGILMLLPVRAGTKPAGAQ
jgi:ACS family hexuronate transporter-like MFS transporter